MKTKSNDNMLKNILVAFCGVLLLASCNEKPVVIDDPRNHPEQFKKVDTVERVKMMEVLKQDTYLNDLDPDAGMEIQKDQINMFYRSEQDSIDDYYDYVVNQDYNGKNYAEEGVTFLHLIRNGDSLHYEIIANNRDVLRFKYLGDDSIHEFFPAKRPGKLPEILPNDADDSELED
ncbi:hypothetical protein [Nonlabens agnitus]|uniref:Uncharacterized protein n=1 Tax=Nonlabens agnitus TaxID=870484 RepID=A0A2S9WTI1_9FLAO|nr:hypothetical protein [Nonlabens agnitus]PRP66778.1 hypothetical protein BST86_06530 [Nonlabens agnitus]